MLLLAVAAAVSLSALRPDAEQSQAAVVDDPFPRLLTIQALNGAEKYHAIVGRVDWTDNVVNLKQNLAADGRSIKALRYFAPRQYQNDVMGMPYDQIYPGHWLFTAGTTTSAAIGANATSIPVVGTAPFSGRVGYFAMIWDGTAVNAGLNPNNPGFWANAEHVKIIGVDSNSITVQRGYDPSSQSFSGGLARSHANGSRIAIHLPGAYTGPEIWSLNQSTASPRDSQGRQLNEVLASWLGQHLQDVYNKNNGTYRSYPGAWDGVWFDATEYRINHTQPPSNLADVNNDLVADGGIITPGRSAWGEGLDVFFSKARQTLGPDKILVGGMMATRGAAYLNGLDLESFPGSGHSSNNYPVYSSSLGLYLSWDEGAVQPAFNDLFTRIGTDEYQSCGQFDRTPDQGTNSDFRFGFGTALLGEGYFAYTNGCFGDYWWDEYSVDVTTGQAVPLSAGVDTVVDHTGYLGQPLGEPQRLLNPTSGNNLASSAGWSLTTSGGGDANYTISGSTINVNLTSPGTSPSDVILIVRPIPLVAGREYTLSFRAKADNGRMAIDLGREIEIAFTNQGRLGGGFLTGEWRDYKIDFVSSITSNNSSLRLKLGGEGGTVSFDQVGVYEGATDVFRRDFTNGIVIVNGSWKSQTVNLKGSFRKIQGTQDPNVNNGATVISVTVPSHDAIVLLRTSGAPTPTNTPTWTPTPVPATPSPTPSSGSGLPDLRIAAMQDPPASIDAGQSFTAAETTKNFGTNTAPPSATRFYLSLDTIKGGGDVLLQGSRSMPSLDPGQQSWGTSTVTVPEGTSGGSYYLLACADDTLAVTETDESNNCRASGTTVQVASSGAADLRVASMRNPPTSASPGQSINVADTTKNFGEDPAPTTTTRYYLSLNTTKDGGDILLKGARSVPSLNPGQQSWGSLDVTVPWVTPSGLFYLLACADDLGAAGETNENNNCRASTSRISIN